MRRREFITLLGSAPAWPMVARAQVAGKVWRIGALGGAALPALSQVYSGFLQGMLDLGYAAFFAIGAYTAALLSSGHFNIHVTFWLLIWIAAAMAALFGFVLGAPTLPSVHPRRRRRVYKHWRRVSNDLTAHLHASTQTMRHRVPGPWRCARPAG